MSDQITIEPKLSKQAIRGAMQYDSHYSNLTTSQIAEKYKVSIKTVLKWKKRTSVQDLPRNRRSKLKPHHIRFIKKLADGKFTGFEQASSRVIANLLETRFNKDKKKLNFTICHSTVNKALNKALSRPRKAKKTFQLTGKNKESRINFIKWVKENKVKGQDIFFTDESRFLLDTPLNPQTNQIRFNQVDLLRLKSGDPVIYEKINQPLPKFTSGFMVAGGISKYGLSKLIFCVGTMNTYCYKRTVNYFKEDVERQNPELYYQQDGASCHTNPTSMEHVKSSFKNLIPFWPPNSPDLSPIEMVWCLLKQKLQERKHNTLEELKSHLVYLWNRFPIGKCKKLIAQFDKKLKIIRESGERINKLPYKKKKFAKRKRARWEKKWNLDNEDDSIERIVYNDKKLKLDKLKAGKAIKKEISKLKKVFTANNKDVLTDKQIKRYHKDNFLKMKKALKEKKENNELQKKKIQELKDKFTHHEKLTLEEWYESLTMKLKLNMIRFKPFKNLSDYLSGTNAETALTDFNDNDVDDENNENSEELLSNELN